MLIPGDPAPHFQVGSSVNARFNFDTVAGRYVVITFFGSSQHPLAESFLREIVARDARFDVTNAVFFGVTTDAQDVDRLKYRSPGHIYFYDLDLAVSRKFGLVADESATPGQQVQYRPTTFILDQSLRVLAVIRLNDDVPAQIGRIFSFLDTLPTLSTLSTAAPVLIVPYVFEPDLCRKLIQYYDERGGQDSGFMRDVDGKTVGIMDYTHKRRMDCEIVDQDLVRTTHNRFQRRLIPAIKQAYQFEVTRIERHIVACYDAAQGAHFKAHRDNTTLGTAHRRFAVTLNLNSDEYDGGEIWFPEFGPKKYKAPSGAAIVFSCSLLHEVPPVTRGLRYAFLPFLYDDAAAKIRERNSQYLGDLAPAGGGNRAPAACQATPMPANRPATQPAAPTLDGTCGCGNPNGCGTCLSAATYRLGVPAGKT